MEKLNSLQGASSFRLEETFPVTLHVIGTSWWLQHSFDASAREYFAEPGRSTVIQRRGDGRPLLEQLESCKIPALDLHLSETDEETVLNGWALGTPEQCYWVEPQLLNEFAPLLASDRFLKLWWSAPRAASFLWQQLGIRTSRVYDIRIAEEVLTAQPNDFLPGPEDLLRRYPPHPVLAPIEVDSAEGLWTVSSVTAALRRVAVLYPLFQAQQALLRNRQLVELAKAKFHALLEQALSDPKDALLLPGVDEQSIWLNYEEWAFRARSRFLDEYRMARDLPPLPAATRERQLRAFLNQLYHSKPRRAEWEQAKPRKKAMQELVLSALAEQEA